MFATLDSQTEPITETHVGVSKYSYLTDFREQRPSRYGD